MNTQHGIISTTTCALLLVSMSATGFTAVAPYAAPSARTTPAACTLLSAADASKALEAQSGPGKEFMDPTGCMWSNDPAARDTSRRVALNTHSVRAFGFAKKPAISTIKIETVSGIGDEAFYQIYPAPNSPFIWVRKGDATFSIRILTQLKPKPFTLDQEKSKEATLAKAAVAKL